MRRYMSDDAGASKPLADAAQSSEGSAPAKGNQSFIDKVKVGGSNMMLGYLTSRTDGFDRAFKELRVDEVSGSIGPVGRGEGGPPETIVRPARRVVWSENH